jgi:hypothetical protein
MTFVIVNKLIYLLSVYMLRLSVKLDFELIDDFICRIIVVVIWLYYK